ncbi:MAG: hypothetical protein F4Z26_07865 [Acidimicrobiaceae bacterium]|nr:hypothetical protein [Acidimicrobiaceae bacterium]MYE65626.1 hypothetical protein [Acidimicrobiaceae bacterium]
MRVLRPNGVSTGCTDRQLLMEAQSPQPSQIRSLMNTRWRGTATVPRLRPRRASAAHCWSCMRTVTPETPARSSWASIRRSRGQTSTPSGRSAVR